VAKGYVVTARVQELAKKLKMRLSKDAIEAMNAHVEVHMKEAAKRAKDNGRKTIKGFDF